MAPALVDAPHDQHLDEPRLPRPADHLVPVVVELRHVDVAVGVDYWDQRVFAPFLALFHLASRPSRRMGHLGIGQDSSGAPSMSNHIELA